MCWSVCEGDGEGAGAGVCSGHQREDNPACIIFFGQILMKRHVSSRALVRNNEGCFAESFACEPRGGCRSLSELCSHAA